MHKGMVRFFLLGCVLGALLSPAAAYCGATSGANSCQPVKSPAHPLQPLSCNVGKLGGVVYKPLIPSNRFDGGDFRESCLVNAGVTCAHPDNAAPLQISPDTSCCSCFLYARYCAGNFGFVTNGHSPATSDHTLVMPASACTGVENWDQAGCPGESIWDEGERMLSVAHKDALWGMSINPIGRRGQHQMHVHLAEVPKSLVAAVVDGVTNKKTNFYLKCGLSSSHKRLDSCTYSATQCTDCPEVHIKHNQAKPSGAAPFLTAYGSKPSRISPNVLESSTLVLRLPTKVAANTWAVVINPHGPAECFFADKGGDLHEACPK